MMPSLVQCGSGAGQHPIMSKDGGCRDCLICKLIKERDRLFLALESASELLVEGKAVQANRCIEHAIQGGVLRLASQNGRVDP